ncbi:SH3 domain-containing protein [Anaerococcus sp. Marseille-P9784]|uniref:SH3 domain-containing protein n=1 Tax=Anaerococcus sp. Marseille-P9784 TaxID=2614127 RepID=UPI001249D84E|nr:SH3 domain-containing protein [Anaerococcus sp. Marseille-P9784]
MNKVKFLLILLLAISTTGCTEDRYVSVRHPEETETSQENEKDLDENKDSDTDKKEETETADQDKKENEESSDGVIYTVDDLVNVRVAPSETSEILTTVNAEDEIIKLGESDNWTRVSINGQTGYIRSDLLKEK